VSVKIFYVICSNIPKGFAVKAVGDDTVVVFFTLQTIEKSKCVVGVQLASSMVNGFLVH